MRACCAALLLAVLALLSSACARPIAQGSYGVSSLEIRGAERVDDEAIKACLATYPRDRFGFALGHLPAPRCGIPPFDAGRAPVDLWAWPWTDWPLLNQGAFDRDRARIERFYRARGYYDARVTDALVLRDEQARTVDIAIEVDEGEPVLVVRVDIIGLQDLPPSVQRAARAALRVHTGEPFDEALYDQSKQALLDAMLEASYAKASVQGQAEIDPDKRIARVLFGVSPGPACRFGDVIIEGHAELPRRPTRLATGIESGDVFSMAAIRDARRALFALGPFASVEIERHPRPDSAVVDLLVRVLPARRFRFGVGVGVESGGVHALEADEATSSFAQWDVHLLGRIEHRNFLGGMRRLQIEERPRYIFDDRFPSTSRGQLGNLLVAELRQPAFLDARTTLVSKARWDRGPDPYGNRFLRHDLLASVGPERHFLEGQLHWSSTIGADLLLPDEPVPFPETRVYYASHVLRYDLRDDPRNPRTGSYVTLGVQHSGIVLPGDWKYLRLTSDARGYLPLPAGFVLAGRARLGFMQIFESAIAVPLPPAEGDTTLRAQSERELSTYRENLALYGPLRQRLRGGGHNSVRGYAPNTLGDAQVVGGRLLSGGLRQWEASLELRIPITYQFGAVVFGDAGDVSQSATYRFDHPQTSLGVGLRYHTLVGPLRLDVALAPSALQVIGQDQRDRSGLTQSPLLFGQPGAVHFTIGEAF